MKSDAGLWQTVVVSILVILYLRCFTTMDVRPQKEVYTPDYSIYHNLTALRSKLADIVRNNPLYVKLHPDYVSRNGMEQYLIEITNFSSNYKAIKHEKVKILFSFGEHAREYLPVESLLHLLNNLLHPHNSYVGTETHVLNEVDLFVVAMANPDGRRYVEATRNYCWRGTSTGVDLNRNFDWEFGGQGSSGNSKDEEYKGPHAFSEPECQVYRDVTELVQFDLFVSFHSGIRQIYIPYADSKSRSIGRKPQNLEEMLKLGRLLAISTKHKYQYGRAVDLNDYTADGTLFDYMAGVRKIPFSYAIELWGPDNYKGSSCFNLFNPPNENLKAVTEEIQPLYHAMFAYMIKWKRKHPGPPKAAGLDGQPHHPDTHSAEGRNNHMVEFPPLTPGYLMLVLLVLVTMLVGIHGRYPFCRRMYQRRRVVSLRSLGSTFALH